MKIERILVSGAFFLGNIAGTPELQMSSDQARDIREALEELCRLYPIGMSEKKIAWVNFAFAVGGWAGPGVVAFARRPVSPKPQRVPTPIRQAEATQGAAVAVQGLPTVGPGDHGPETAKVPSDMWRQPGDIMEPSDIAGEE